MPMTDHALDSIDENLGPLLETSSIDEENREFLFTGKVIVDKLVTSINVMSSLDHFLEVIFTPSRFNRYIINFSSLEMLKSVINDGPWCVMGHVFTLKEWSGECLVDKVAFWVQIHGFKLDQMTDRNARIIDAYLGNLIDCEPMKLANIMRRTFLRVHAYINATRPLKKDMLVNMSGRVCYKISFKYEKFSYFYFTCGKLGHLAKQYGI